MATHFLGCRIDGTLTRFLHPITDSDFEPIARAGLPYGWVAWHIEDGEDIDNSERVKALALLPVALDVGGVLAGCTVTGQTGGAVEYPFPAANWAHWLERARLSV